MSKPQSKVIRVGGCLCGIQDLYAPVAQCQASKLCIPASQARSGDTILGILVGLEVGALGWVLSTKGGQAA